MIYILLIFFSMIIAFIVGVKFGDKKGIFTINTFDVWSVHVFSTNKPLHRLNKSDLESKLKKPVFTSQDVNDLKALFVADPFLIKEKECWYLFAEVLDRSTMIGKIGLATCKDGNNWSYEKIVLDEPYHLSYPYVFRWEDSIYMIPETNQTRSIRIYKAIGFPYEWEHCGTLLEGDNFTDVSVFYHHNYWWLFTSTVKRLNNNLRLFSAPDLFGNWIEHPMSPIITDDAVFARPAGRIYQNGNELLRYAQNCSRVYGESVSCIEITELTKDYYKEKICHGNPILYPGISDWNRKGMHHIDSVKINDNEWIHAVDGHTEVKLAGFKKNGTIRIIERAWLQSILKKLN